MAVSLKHTTQAVGTDAGNGEIRKAQWNEEHTLTAAADTILGAVSAGAVGEITCTAAGRALLDDADAAAQRTTLGIGAGDSPTFSGVSVTGVSEVSAGSAASPSIVPSGDTNTGLLFPAADTVAVSTNGSERMRITSAASENILFGLAASQGAGRVQSGGDSATSAFLSFVGSTAQREAFRFANLNGTIASLGTTGTSLNISTNGSVRATISSTGDVGIGVVPTARFDVAGNYAGNIVAVSALDVDCSAGNYFTKTISANSTFTFSNAPSSRSFSFTLELTHTSGTVTWPAAVKWPGDTAPTLTTGKTHLFMFVTDDAGTRWRGASLTNYTN